MARTISWLHLIPQMRKTLAGSARTHYTRKDLEYLFQIQPRRASALLEMLPTVKMGTAHGVGREDLIRFLDTVYESEDASATIKAMAEDKRRPRRTPKTFMQADIPPVTIDELPGRIELAAGTMRITFTTMEEFVSALYALAYVLEHQLDEFAHRYEPKPERSERDDEAEDIRNLLSSPRAADDGPSRR